MNTNLLLQYTHQLSPSATNQYGGFLRFIIMYVYGRYWYFCILFSKYQKNWNFSFLVIYLSYHFFTFQWKLHSKIFIFTKKQLLSFIFSCKLTYDLFKLLFFLFIALLNFKYIKNTSYLWQYTLLLKHNFHFNILNMKLHVINWKMKRIYFFF